MPRERKTPSLVSIPALPQDPAPGASLPPSEPTPASKPFWERFASTKGTLSAIAGIFFAGVGATFFVLGFATKTELDAKFDQLLKQAKENAALIQAHDQWARDQRKQVDDTAAKNREELTSKINEIAQKTATIEGYLAGRKTK